jgi:hypothetical protein
MNDVYISIGTHCSSAYLLDQIGLKKETLPFDWAFSTIEFVYDMFKLIFDKKDCNDIVYNHFYACDKRALLIDNNNYHTTNYGMPQNSKYRVVFPHDTPDEHDKYIRRFERMKNLLLDETNTIHFIYVSTSKHPYILDGIDCNKDFETQMCKLYDLFKGTLKNFDITVFHTSDLILNNIKCIKIDEPQDNWCLLLSELKQKF